MNWQEKRERNKNQGKSCFYFSNYILPFHFLWKWTLSSTPSIDSSWILRNNILHVKIASILLPVEFYAAGVHRLFVFTLNVLLIMRSHLSENRHENFSPCGPSYRSLFQGPVSYCLRNMKKGAEKRNTPLPWEQILCTGLIVNPDRFVHQETIARW